jgi:hypothetical protein
MELNFIQEEVPKVTRAGGSGREAEPWEQHLSPLKESPEISFRTWDYEKRPSAVSRMTSVRDRLRKAVPEENWDLVVREIPDSDPPRYGVYVTYRGEFSDEEMAENARKHQERSERVRAAREAPTEDPGDLSDDSEGDTVDPTPLSPKERVAQARKARAS